MWEVLTGVLAGGPRFSTDVTGPADFSRPQAVAMFLLAIDPGMAMPYDTFTARVDDLIDRVHRSKRAQGHNRVAVPGERGDATAAQRHTDGIPVPNGLLATLQEIGGELGVAGPLTGTAE